MSKGKFIAFLVLVGVWMPGCLAVYIWSMLERKFGEHTIIGFLVLLYAIFVPNVVYSFWDEFANLFGRKTTDTRGDGLR
jgi:hypothetical protein